MPLAPGYGVVVGTFASFAREDPNDFGRWPRLRRSPRISSDGDNALDVLEPLARASVRLYVLGEPYTSGLGVHDVHLNQAARRCRRRKAASAPAGRQRRASASG